MKMKAVEEEFGEEFWDVVQGCADMGMGKTMTADVIGYDRSAFLRLVRKYGQGVRWPDYADLRVWRDREYPPEWAERIRQGRRRTAVGCRWVKFDGKTMLQRDYAAMLGISETQAWRHRVNGIVEEVVRER